MRSAIVSIVAIVAMGCYADVAPKPEPDSRRSPASTVCERACSNMSRLKCPGWSGAPAEDGHPAVSCVTVCTDTSNAAKSAQLDDSLHPECVARASSCTQSLACFQ